LSPKPRALVVEDDACVAEVLQLALEWGGYQVRLAPRGQTALEMAQAERPDLITLDLRLPDLDGHYVLEALQPHPERQDAPIPVIVISGGHYRPSPTDQVVAVLPKPFELTELQRVVQAVLATCNLTEPASRAATA